MLNISGIHEGFVLDHIQAGMSLQIYHDLKLDKLDCSVAIIKNAKSNKVGKKDIIKVECPIEALDLDILGFIDHNITVNVIKGDRIVEKKELKLPKQAGPTCIKPAIRIPDCRQSMRIMTEPRTVRIRRSSAATTGITVMPIARSQISRWTICGLTRTRGRCRLQRNSRNSTARIRRITGTASF